MPLFVKGGTLKTPFGPTVYMRSTKGALFESYTFAAATMPAVTIDGNANQKILPRGLAIAKITSGGDAGKVGPFQTGATDGRQTLTNIVGVNDTFLPWQLIEGDREIAVCYAGSLMQGWCLELDSGGNQVVLTNATAAGMVAQKTMNILFK